MEKHHNTTHERAPSVPPRIYAASLADYTAGHLHGAWIDPTQELDDLRAAVTKMLAASSEPDAEEFAIHDYEGFCGFQVGEYDTLESIHQIVCGIDEHGEAYAEYIALVGTEDASLDGFADLYQGSYESVDAFIEQFASDMGWDSELERLQAASGIGQFLTIDRKYLRDAICSEWQVRAGANGVHVFLQ